MLGVMSPSSSFAEVARRVFDNLSLELQKSTEDDNFTEEFLKIMENNDVDEEDFLKYLEFEHEDEDCAISTSGRNHPTHATRVTFDDDDDIIELTNYLTDSTQRVYKETLLERVKRPFLPLCVSSGRDLSI